MTEKLRRQLLREAYAIIDDCYHGRDCQLDLRDWLKTAKPLIEDVGRPKRKRPPEGMPA